MIELILIVLFVAVLYVFIHESPSSLGASGERKVQNKIATLVNDEEGIQVFNDLILETPDGTTQIDHIILSRFGIFVIETKNLKGWIFGGSNQRQWTQTLYRKKYKFQNPLHQNYKHIKAVQGLLGVNQSVIYSIVVFVGDSQFRTEMPGNVLNLRDLLPYVRSHNTVVLGERDIEIFSQILSNPAYSDPSNKKKHIKYLTNGLSTNNATSSTKSAKLLLYILGILVLMVIFVGNDQEQTSSPDNHVAYTATVTARSLRVRSAPTLNSDVINQLTRGDVVEIQKAEGDWSFVSSGSVKGWVSNTYLSTK